MKFDTIVLKVVLFNRYPITSGHKSSAQSHKCLNIYWHTSRCGAIDGVFVLICFCRRQLGILLIINKQRLVVCMNPQPAHQLIVCTKSQIHLELPAVFHRIPQPWSKSKHNIIMVNVYWQLGSAQQA